MRPVAALPFHVESHASRTFELFFNKNSGFFVVRAVVEDVAIVLLQSESLLAAILNLSVKNILNDSLRQKKTTYVCIDAEKNSKNGNERKNENSWVEHLDLTIDQA